jgi:hypothetical protein
MGQREYSLIALHHYFLASANSLVPMNRLQKNSYFTPMEEEGDMLTPTCVADEGMTHELPQGNVCLPFDMYLFFCVHLRAKASMFRDFFFTLIKSFL